ncbi:hypothetical protein L1987_48249 [Smallanthus sonchifolius]|uniref:Uncharacterized protein n=1 Tax=Smallanthus sonchifolius TaxID=185202 RepID=A0ACB9FRG1_9ASTR|nr:hypothetical protein L1987_48249 [Smallanthus sonchifolius]
MPPKKSKAEIAKKQTYGLKNRNKKKERGRKKELNDLFKIVVVQSKVHVGVELHQYLGMFHRKLRIEESIELIKLEEDMQIVTLSNMITICYYGVFPLRGQPKRHLLTVGWSVFMSSKRLCAVIVNIVEVNGEVKNEIGMVVIRGNSVVTVKGLEQSTIIDVNLVLYYSSYSKVSHLLLCERCFGMHRVMNCNSNNIVANDYLLIRVQVGGMAGFRYTDDAAVVASCKRPFIVDIIQKM